jgi:hypothetical protein
VSDIFREIEDELRRENFAKLWQRYGYYVVGILVAVIVATGVVVGWRQYAARLRADEGERYQVALDLMRSDKLQEAKAAFAALAQGSGERAVLARFEGAALLAKSGDPVGAAARYQAIASDASIDESFRDLATILSAQYGLASGDPHAIIRRLQPLVASAGAWQPSALELTALAQLKTGDKASARANYQRLADDEAAPRGMRTRATEMVAALAQ